MSQSLDKITVVVPCYNVADYLPRCLDSLLNQKYQNLDVLMIEDCSTDNTKAIVSKYEEENKDFRAIYNETNGGLGNARNIAIKATNSKFITFLDSDDWVPENYISELHDALISSHADLSVCDIFLRFDDTEQDFRVVVYDNKPDKYGLINTGLAASSNNKLFKKELFENLEYPKGIVNEDIPVTLAILSKNKTTYTKDTYYNYYQRSGSIQNSNITSRRFDIFNAVALLKRNLGSNADKKTIQAVEWHQIIAVFLYVIPKAKGVMHRKRLIREFIDRADRYNLQISKNPGFKNFLKQSKVGRMYGETLLWSTKTGHYLLASITMGAYQYYISSRIARRVVFALRHPRTFMKNVYKKFRAYLKHKVVIKNDVAIADLITAARKQKKIFSQNPVSVIIPNYNYEKFMMQRVYSILAQTEKIGEVIILDDNSTDNSVEMARRIKAEIDSYVPIRLFNNKKNKGTFRQWEKGFAEARNEFIWIAEADDYSDPRFLDNATKPLKQSPEVMLSYVNTGYVNEKGLLLGHVKPDIDYQQCGHWDSSYINNGLNEAKSFAYLNNTIANVSSVVFRKREDINYSKLFADAIMYRQAGDWIFYVNYMVYGDIAYTDKILNYYRLHGNNVSSTTKAQDHINEILEIQSMFKKKLNLNDAHAKKMQKRITMLRKAWGI